jgi:hypothetical protein
MTKTPPTLPATMQYEKRDRIAIITINRPDAMNAFTADMLRGWTLRSPTSTPIRISGSRC